MPFLPADRRRDVCRIFLPWAVLACLAAALPAQDDEAATGTPPPSSQSLWLEIRDAKDRVPRDLTAADLDIRLGEETLEVGTLTPAGERAQIVLYFDRPLSTSGTLRRGASSLNGLTRQLSELGDVEVAVADPRPEVLIDSRDPLLLGERLARMALVEEGGEAILELRRRTLRELQRAAPTSDSGAEQAALVAEALRQEAALVSTHRQELLGWLSEKGDRGPKILILVFDGFDVDPLAFYAQHLDEATLRAAAGLSASDPALLELEAAHLGTARTLAALGWTVLPLAVDTLGKNAVRFESKEVVDEQGGTSTTQGITFNPGSIFKRRGEDDEDAATRIEAELVDPAAARRPLAELSGGQAIASDQALRDAVKRLGERFQLTYSSSIPADGGLLPLEVRAKRSDLDVRAPRWASPGTPPMIARIRLQQLFAGAEPSQGFDVTAALETGAPEAGALETGTLETGTASETQAVRDLELRLDLRDLETEARGRHDLRLTVAVLEDGRERQLLRQIFPRTDLTTIEAWTHRASIAVPANAAQVAVLVEDLDSGRWGGSLAARVQRPRGAVKAGPALPALPVIEIERPEREVLRGRVRFETEVWNPAVARVAFLLDDREVAEATQAPWNARLELGRVPRRRHLTAIAYDAAGEELGRHEVVINGGRSGVDIEIVRPQNGRGTGWVEVEAEVSVPLEHRLDRVLFFWNNEPIATLFAPPFVQNIFIPEEQAAGYIRAVAMLDDGTVTEDVLFMNGPESSESLDVNLVELYTVVTDRNSRPVRGLQISDFTVYEDGTRQEISSFSDASDLPLTLGMAIDSSASMFVKMPRVQEAAINFLESTFGEQDRAFIVDFDSSPRLARSPTQDLDRLIRAIRNLEPDGRTALWESVVYSLVQLQGVRGRKALIVFSDGADEDDQFPFRTCLDLAERMGVPIYLILMRKEPGENANLNLFTRSFNSRVDRLVEATGGRVFYAKEYRDLGEVYAEIEQELRSQYLLAYYPKSNGGDGWREVRVEVSGRGLKPRTLSGYWQ